MLKWLLLVASVVMLVLIVLLDLNTIWLLFSMGLVGTGLFLNEQEY